MSGVGSFSRQNTTLYVGRMREYGEGRGENQLIKHFGEYGDIEKGKSEFHLYITYFI